MELVCTVLDDILQPYVMITIKEPKLVIIVKIGYHKLSTSFLGMQNLRILQIQHFVIITIFLRSPAPQISTDFKNIPYQACCTHHMTKSIMQCVKDRSRFP